MVKIPFWLKAASVCLIISVLFLNNFLLHLDQPMAEPFDGPFIRMGISHGDEAHVVLTLKHYAETIFAGNFKDFLTMPIFYGYPDSLLYSEPFFFQAAVAAPIYYLTGNILVAFHLIAALTIYFSFLAMFALSYYLTKHFWASILGSIIFVFNPFIFARFPEHITYYSLMWIPLIFLMFEKFLATTKPKYLFWMFILFALNLLTVLTFCVMLTIFLPIYAAIRIYQTKFDWKKFFNWPGAGGMVIFLAVTAAFASVLLSFYLKNPIGRSLYDTAYYSAWPTDFLIASANNLFYGGSRLFLQSILGPMVFNIGELTEHSVFLGLVPITLLILSFFWVRKSQSKKIWLSLVILFLISVILAIGPLIFITQDSYFPGPYWLLYQIDPLLHFLRVASRFIVFGFMFLGLICAFTLVEIDKKGYKKWLIYLIVGLVFLEYFNQPWDFMTIPQENKQLYSAIDQDPKIKVLLELPMGNLDNPRFSQAKNQFVDGHYELWAATLHSKKLLNGYSSYTPPSYVKRVDYLTVNFPNPVKLDKLREWGVDAIVLHRNEFADPSKFDQLKQQLTDLGLKELQETDNIALFSLRE